MAPSLSIEQSYWQKGYLHVAGIDEAGRGCLAGPVVAAATIFPQGFVLKGVNDSKKLSPQKRAELAKEITKTAISVGVGLCTPEEIDELNILWAAMEAMRRAVQNLTPAPHYLLIDGNRAFPDSPWPYETVIKGDARSFTIAAASIIAKTVRDDMMRCLHEDYPEYGWASNMGYPTKKHYEALAQYGSTPLHRQSFRLR
ncbi:MAG: ribonuclease HII [Rhodothermales bacterium]